MARYDNVGMTRWRDILLRLKAKRHKGQFVTKDNLRCAFHVCWRSAVDKKRPLHAWAPGFDSRPWNSLAVLFCSFFFLTFFYLLAGFILFIVLPLYSFARCWVKRIFIFAYKGFEERIIGWCFFFLIFCSGNQSVVCMPNALALHCLTHWMGLALKLK